MFKLCFYNNIMLHCATLCRKLTSDLKQTPNCTMIIVNRFDTCNQSDRKALRDPDWVLLIFKELSPHTNLQRNNNLNPVQARGYIVPPPLNRSISSKRLGVRSFCFVTFLSWNFPFRKVQFHQSAIMYVFMATIQLYGLTLKLGSPLFFKYFQLRETFCEINFYDVDIIIL